NELAINRAKAMDIDLRLLYIPRDVMDAELVAKGEVQFYELAYLEVDLKKEGYAVELTLKNFLIPNPELIPIEKRDAIKSWTDFIDYWSVDWNYREDTFHNQWQSFRIKRNPNLELTAKCKYKESGNYNILVKVIDVFGNDTTKLVRVVV
ncbi:MAG: hypothetical protein ACE5KT_05540, partial [Methanosarcinales archaeon]